MINATRLAAIFLAGDRPFRPQGLAQYWVVQTVKNDAPRAVEVYEQLIERGGTNYAAKKFLILLQQAHEPFRFRYYMIDKQRRPVALPA